MSNYPDGCNGSMIPDYPRGDDDYDDDDDESMDDRIYEEMRDGERDVFGNLKSQEAGYENNKMD